MDHIAALKDHLHRLRLHGALATLDERLHQAVVASWNPSELLLHVLADETTSRHNKVLARRLARSRLDPSKTLETYDFRFNPSLHEPTIRELAACHFVTNADVLLILGPSGAGKSHLAQALGHEACRKGHDVLCSRTDLLLKELWSAHGDGSRRRRLRHVIDIDLLILDDFGLIPLTEEQQTDLYEIICGRYERRATIYTSNRDFAEWMTVFSNSLLASAAMDRLVHRAHQFIITGKSYRAETFTKRHRSLSPPSQRQPS